MADHYSNDAVWARFYRDGKSLGELCEEFRCGIYDLSPWLLAPLVRAAAAVKRHEPVITRAFQIGDRVMKTKGSSWNGRVVGFYSTAMTPIGYAVESEREPGSVQIYPEAALAPASESTGATPTDGGENGA